MGLANQERDFSTHAEAFSIQAPFLVWRPDLLFKHLTATNLSLTYNFLQSPAEWESAAGSQH